MPPRLESQRSGYPTCSDAAFRPVPAPSRSEVPIALAAGLIAIAVTVALGGSGRAASTPGLAAAASTLVWRRT
jgi:Mrp family chromosome partitioning ATPase